MTSLLDSSALIKLYLTESGQETIQNLIAQPGVVAVTAIVYPEVRAGLAFAYRQGRIDERRLSVVRTELDLGWRGLFEIPVTTRLCREAGDLAQEFGLRGYDSVQLAGYAELSRSAAPDGANFITFDLKLAQAATLWRQRYGQAH